MENSLFNLKFTAKQLARQAKKTEQEAKKEKLKVKKAIQQGNPEVARIYASNAIRKTNEGINLVRLSSRVESVASRVQTAVTMKQLTRNMAGVVGGMEKAMQSMNLEQISMVMDRFEQQFEDLNVQTESMEASIGGVVAEDVPVEQVDQLMLQIADEAGLEFNQSLGVNPVPSNSLAHAQKDENTALNERLYKLRNS